MKKIFSIVIILQALLLMTGMTAYARNDTQCSANGPDRLLRIKIDQILKVLDDSTLSEDAKKEKLKEIVDPIFNYPLMAKLTLGRKYWYKFSEKQRRLFTKLFISRLKASYLDKISLYSGGVKADVVCGHLEPNGKKAVVPVTVTAKGSTVDIRYHFYHFPDGWKIYDVEIKGVSIVSSYHAQFEQVLSNGSIEDLLNALKAPLPEKSKKPVEKEGAKSDGSKI